jgi:hypothetical protein
MSLSGIKIGILGLLLITMQHSVFAQSNDYNIDFFSQPVFNHSDTVQLRFYLRDLKGNKLGFLYDSINRKDVFVIDTIIEGSRTEVLNPIYINESFIKFQEPVLDSGQPKSIKKTLQANEITVSVLVDRSGSMTQLKINKVNEVLSGLLNSMPDSSIFLSWFNNDITPSVPITRDEFKEHMISLPEDPANKHTALYNSIYTKLLEFDSAAVIPNLKYEPVYRRTYKIYQRKTPKNYLIVLTDGKDESEKIAKYRKSDFEKIDSARLLKTIQEYGSKKNKVEIWMIGIREEGDKSFDDAIMKRICEKAGNPENYRLGGVDSLPKIFEGVIQNILPDYQISLRYPGSSMWNGVEREIKLKITFPDNKKARGSVTYKRGSPTDPIRLNDISKYEIIGIGILIGLVILLIIFSLIQVIVPLSRSFLFKVKHVKKYSAAADTEKISCSWCKEEIVSGEKAVFCCEHISHWKCWKENSHQCPNHPDICEKGKQDFFDFNDLSGSEGTDSIVKQNKRRLWRWVFTGAIGGMVAWILYEFLLEYGIFDILIQKLIPSSKGNELYFIERFGSLPLLGLLVGWILSAAFLYLEEFRRINLIIALILFLRSLIGAAIGFITFFIGSIILIQFGKDVPRSADILAFLLFGPLLGYYLSIKTTLSAKHGVLGGLTAILFSFATLYLLPYIIQTPKDEYMLVISLSIYGGGLGLAISAIRQRAEKYFLVLSNAPVKNKEFPLHKWISKSADYGAFTIGKGNKSIIKMDWEKGDLVSEDVHAVIYLEKSNKEYPILSIRDTKNKTYLNDHILLRPEKEYLLHSGDTFKIGETIFKYEEKQI